MLSTAVKVVTPKGFPFVDQEAIADEKDTSSKPAAAEGLGRVAVLPTIT